MNSCLFLLLVSLAIPASSYGKSVSDYRDPAKKAAYAENAKNRVQSIRALLKGKLEKAPELPSLAGKGVHELHTSTLVKDTLSEVSKRMQFSERYDAPPVLDPSLQSSEQKGKLQAHRADQCRKMFSDVKGISIDQMLDQINEWGVKPWLANGKSWPKGGSVDIDLQHEPVLAPKVLGSIRSTIEIQEPKNTRSIYEVIGLTHDAVEVTDGTIDRIWFKGRPNNPEFEAVLTLSMLISVRTGYDFYFLTVLDCLYGRVNEQIAEAQKEYDDNTNQTSDYMPWNWGSEGRRKHATEVKNKLAPMAEFLSKQVGGALAANGMLTRLNREQLDFLIDLFLTLRGNDIPIAEDFTHEEGISKAAIDSSATSLTGDPSQRQNSILADFTYYRELHRDLNRLSDFLEEELGRDTQKKELIEEMKKGGGGK